MLKIYSIACGQSGSRVVTSQNDLDTQLTGCTTIVGSIEIANYTGSFALPNVTSVTGSIYTTPDVSNITSFEMADLSQTLSISLANVPKLTSINLPGLRTIHAIQIGGENVAKIYFTSLLTVGSINLYGNFLS